MIAKSFLQEPLFPSSKTKYAVATDSPLVYASIVRPMHMVPRICGNLTIWLQEASGNNSDQDLKPELRFSFLDVSFLLQMTFAWVVVEASYTVLFPSSSFLLHSNLPIW